jgi:hypothetical protein
MLDQLLSDRDVEKITGRARSTLQKDRVAGTGIPFVRLGRLVRYRPSDLSAFLDALPSRRSTSETARDRADYAAGDLRDRGRAGVARRRDCRHATRGDPSDNQEGAREAP